MGDPEPRDHEPTGAGGSEPETTVAELGPNGPPGTIGITLAGEVDPGQATGGVTLGYETSATATGADDATDADRTDSSPPQRPAPNIAGYVIEGELGRGGMGVVYRARQVGLNRPCALKVILAGAHADPVAAVRFLGEAEAVAKLQHPNIVQIHSIGEADGLPFLELEYLPQGSLDRTLDGTPWPARRAATLIEALARGVSEAHRLEIIHRDLKPGNILIAADGTPKIADFGLAKSLNMESGLTATESIMGTPSYMAPEQAEGKNKQVGPLVDVYALGAILYELLTGRPPFRGTTMLETLEQVKTAEPVPPSRLVPGLSRDAETIALKCLQKDPAKRYTSAESLAEDLQRFLEDRPIRARRVSSAERLLLWGRRNKLVAGLLAGLVVTLVAGFVVSTSQWIRAEANAEQLAQQLYTSDMRVIQQLDEAGDVGRMGKLLRRHIPLAGKTDWRGFEWDVFWRRYRGAQPIRTLPLDDAPWDMAATPSGQTVAILVFDHANKKVQVILWDAATGREPRVFEGPRGKFAGAVALSPNGQVFATGSQFDGRGRERGCVNIWDAATGELQQSLGGPNGLDKDVEIGALAFSPDGKTLLSGSGDGTINLWDLKTGHVLKTFKGHTEFVRGVFSPDGSRIASASGDKTVKLWDVKSGNKLFTSRYLSYMVTSVAFSPGDGRYLAAGSWGSDARLWDVARPRDPHEIELLGQPLTTALDVSFSPDGRYLAASNSNTIRLWIVETGEAWATLKGHSNVVSSVAFLDGGRTLASGSSDRTVKLWDIARAGADRDVFSGHSGSVHSLAFTREGKTLASGGSDGLIRLWDVESGRERPRLENPDKSPGVVLSLAIHGRILADNRTCLWDLETGRLLKGLPTDRTTSWQVAFSHDGDGAILATASSEKVWLWDVSKWELRQSIPADLDGITSLAFSPDGRFLSAGGSDRTVRLWDVATGRELVNLDHRFRGHQGFVDSLAFSPDGRTLVSGSWDGTVKVWDVADAAKPTLRHTLAEHAGMVWAVAYSPDGKTIASGSEDKTIKLWDPTTGRERCTLVGHTSKIRCLAFSRDGRILASGDGGGTIRYWRR
jgi:eukaryotic-like serine/threonine-protein kinase